MLIPLILFFVSFFGIVFFLIWKVPLLVNLSQENNTQPDFIVTAKEKLEDGVKKEIKGKFEEFLQMVLSNLRRSIVKVDRITTKWLYTLKRRRKRKENGNKPE